MSDRIQLEEEQGSTSQYMSRRVLGSPTKPSMIKLVKRFGFAKSDTQAYYVLLVIGIIALVIALLIFGYFVLGIGHAKSSKSYVQPGAATKLPDSVRSKINAAHKK